MLSNVGSETSTLMLGVKQAQSIGLGVATMTEIEIDNNISATVNHEETSNNPDARSITLTTKQSLSDQRRSAERRFGSRCIYRLLQQYLLRCDQRDRTFG